jgi:hypothetical protein
LRSKRSDPTKKNLEVFPDIESFLELRRRENRFEAFFLKYENHVRFHKSDEADHLILTAAYTN